MTDVYFHEDDYCQVELTPAENQAFILRELDKAATFADAHRVEGDIGWTEVYRLPAPPKALADEGIRRQDFERLFAAGERFDRVFTGYGTHREECAHTLAWRVGRAVVFAALKDETVTAIWFDCFPETEDMAEDACCLLERIARNYDLLYVDWGWNFCVHIQDSAAVREAIVRQFHEITGAQS